MISRSPGSAVELKIRSAKAMGVMLRGGAVMNSPTTHLDIRVKRIYDPASKSDGGPHPGRPAVAARREEIGGAYRSVAARSRANPATAAVVVHAGRSAPAHSPEPGGDYRQKVTDLHQALQREGSRAEAAEILRDLIEEITLTPGNGELRIDLRGELAGILRLASGSKKPIAADRDGLEQMEREDDERRGMVCFQDRRGLGRRRRSGKKPSRPTDRPSRKDPAADFAIAKPCRRRPRLERRNSSDHWLRLCRKHDVGVTHPRSVECVPCPYRRQRSQLAANAKSLRSLRSRLTTVRERHRCGGREARG
jgi:hypothetical protein